MGSADKSGLSLGPTLNQFAENYIAAYPNVILIVLTIIAVYFLYQLLFAKKSETFSPTATMYLVGDGQDQSAIAGADRWLGQRAFAKVMGGERMEGGVVEDDSEQTVVFNPHSAVQVSTDPSSPLFPGSASWQVLNSPDFNCGGRDLKASSDAWSWMNSVARGEKMQAGPKTDGDFTKIMAGL